MSSSEEAANKERTMECEISVCSECGDRTRDPSCFFRCPRCGDVCCPDHISEHDCKTREQEQVDGLEPGWVKLLRSKLAEQTAEIERLKGTLELTERQLAATVDDLMSVITERDKQLAARDAMLAAATEFRFGNVCIWANKTQLALSEIDGNPQQWHVRKQDRGAGKPKAWLNTKFFTFDDAYQAAIAAGWLKPSPGEAGTGGESNDA